MKKEEFDKILESIFERGVDPKKFIEKEFDITVLRKEAEANLKEMWKELKSIDSIEALRSEKAEFIEQSKNICLLPPTLNCLDTAEDIKKLNCEFVDSALDLYDNRIIKLKRAIGKNLVNDSIKQITEKLEEIPLEKLLKGDISSKIYIEDSEVAGEIALVNLEGTESITLLSLKTGKGLKADLDVISSVLSKVSFRLPDLFASYTTEILEKGSQEQRLEFIFNTLRGLK